MSLEPSSDNSFTDVSYPLETLSNGLIIEHKLGRDLNETDVKDVKTFLSNELMLSKQPGLDHDEVSRRLNSTFNNSFAIDLFGLAMKDYPVSIITLIREQKHSIVGTCTTIITKEHGIKIGKLSQMGLGHNFQHKNVGPEILIKHIQILKSEGVSRIHTRTWEDSRRMLDKTGIHYTQDYDDPDGLTIQLT